MTETTENKRLAPPISRRRRRPCCRGAGAARRSPTTPRTCRRNVPDWTRTLGDGVGVRPYGHPSKFEKDVIRRTVPWLTATPESSVSLHAAARTRRHHHAERPVLRAPPRRHRRGRSARLPADDPRPGRQAADLHARRHQAPAARQPHPFPRMRRQFRHGVARRAAQRLPVHPRHGALRAIHRRAAEDFAGAGRASSRTRSGCSPKAPTPRR